MRPTSQKTNSILIAAFLTVLFTGSAAVLYAQNAGALDSTFGVEGIITAYINNKETVKGSAVQADGKIVITGYTNIDSNSLYDDFLVARYNTDGSPDITFGVNGVVLTDFGHSYDEGAAVVIQSDGKIIVAGTTGKPDSLNKDFALARYNDNGELDTTFGQEGRVITDFAKSGDYGTAIAIQKDNKILIAGSTENLVTLQFDYGVVRYDSIGRIDSLFSDRGRVRVDFKNRDDICNGIVIMDDGSIIVGGMTVKNFNGSDFSIAKIKPNGTFDSTFGDEGKNTIDVKKYDFGNALAYTGFANKILLAGTTTDGADLTKFSVLRIKGDGTLDSTFGEQGQVLTALGPKSYCNSIAVQSDNKMILAGRSVSNVDLSSVAMERLFGDGTVDSAFGQNGQVITKFGTINSVAYSVSLQTDGKIILAGNTFDDPLDIVVARYYGETVLPVRILSMSAQKSGQSSLVKWQTSAESPGSYYTVERSSNGINFASLGTVKATGVSSLVNSYSYTDYSPLAGINYYRLKIADGSSKTFYSSVVTLDFNNAAGITVYPNPVHNTLFVKGVVSADAKAEITDLSGKTIISAQLNAGRSIQVQQLQKGLYFLRITDGNNISVTRFVKD